MSTNVSITSTTVTVSTQDSSFANDSGGFQFPQPHIFHPDPNAPQFASTPAPAVSSPPAVVEVVKPIPRSTETRESAIFRFSKEGFSKNILNSNVLNPQGNCILEIRSAHHDNDTIFLDPNAQGDSAKVGHIIWHESKLEYKGYTKSFEDWLPVNNKAEAMSTAHGIHYTWMKRDGGTFAYPQGDPKPAISFRNVDGVTEVEFFSQGLPILEYALMLVTIFENGYPHKFSGGPPPPSLKFRFTEDSKHKILNSNISNDKGNVAFRIRTEHHHTTIYKEDGTHVCALSWHNWGADSIEFPGRLKFKVEEWLPYNKDGVPVLTVAGQPYHFLVREGFLYLYPEKAPDAVAVLSEVDHRAEVEIFQPGYLLTENILAAVFIFLHGTRKVHKKESEHPLLEGFAEGSAEAAVEQGAEMLIKVLLGGS